MVIIKNQIRPRRKKFRFSNAEILLFDSVGTRELLGPAPAGSALAIIEVQLRTNIVVPYANEDVGAFLLLIDDFALFTFPCENNAGTSTSFSDLFTTTGLNVLSGFGAFGVVDSFGEVTYAAATNWIDAADIALNGGIYLQPFNGGSDLTDGDPLNYLDIFLSYEIVNL